VESKIVVEHNGETFTSDNNVFNFGHIAVKEALSIDGVKNVYLYENIPTEVAFENGAVIKVDTPVSFEVNTKDKMGDIVKQIKSIAKQIKAIKTKAEAQLKTTAVYEFEVEI